MTDAWSRIRDELAMRVADLGPQGAIVLREPDPPAPGGASTRRGLLGRLRRPKPPLTRYAQIYRMDDGYGAECVGSAYWDSTPEQQAALVAAGWLEPLRTAHFPTDNYSRFYPLAAHARAAADAVEALAILGCEPTTAWVWDHIDS